MRPSAASDVSVGPKVQGARQGDALVVRSGGEIVIEHGAKLWSVELISPMPSPA